jgi:Ran GTPase-activating protein (RanGAP) involved in mRNA processing and transport
MIGINGMGDFYSTPATAENLYSLFSALRNIQILNLHSSTLNRGHGLEVILKAIPWMDQLKELRLEGWQMDRISVSDLVESIKGQHKQSVTFLSMRSCLFLGEDTFLEWAAGLKDITKLRTLNISYCNLGDNEIIPLVEAIKSHPSIERVHLGGNCCRTQQSVSAIATLIGEQTCKLVDLNLRAMWVGFSEEGLVQRFVNLTPVFDALSENESIQHLTISENYLEDNELRQITKALLAQPKRQLKYLDVGDNPFEESGAKTLIELVRGLPALHDIRFENHFLPYRCSELVKLLSEFNHYDKLFSDKSVEIPLSIWPHAFARLQQQGVETSMPSDQRATNHIFRFLRSTTGPNGHELSLQIALHNNGK